MSESFKWNGKTHKKYTYDEINQMTLDQMQMYIRTLSFISRQVKAAYDEIFKYTEETTKIMERVIAEKYQTKLDL